MPRSAGACCSASGSSGGTGASADWAYQELFRGDKVRIDQVASTEASLDCGSHGRLSQGGSVYIAWPADTRNPQPEDTWIYPRPPDGAGISYDDSGYLEECKLYAGGNRNGETRTCSTTRPYPRLTRSSAVYFPKFSLTGYTKVASYSVTLKWKIHGDMAQANPENLPATCEVKWTFSVPDASGTWKNYEASTTRGCSNTSSQFLALPSVPTML